MSKIGGVVVVASLLAFGCSRGLSTPPEPTPTPVPDLTPVDVAGFCAAHVYVAGNRAFACRGGSRAAHDVWVQVTHACETATAAIAGSHALFDPAAAAACIAEMAALDCWQEPAAAPACALVFTGTVADADSCYPNLPFDAEECLPGSHCVADDWECTGRCERYRLLGESCTEYTLNRSGRCAAPLVCERTCLETTNTPFAIGTMCVRASECTGDQGTLACAEANGPVPPGDTTGGTCQPPADTGRCLTGSDCRSGICQRAPTDTGIFGTCVPPKRLGDACAPGQCGPGTTCGAIGKCMLLPSIGQPCSPSVDERPACLDGVCDASTLRCVPIGEQGDRCPAPVFEPPCIPGRLRCDQATSTCLPACFPGNACGAPGQACCANQLCNTGAACNAGVCG
jgi:hypothetical protein